MTDLFSLFFLNDSADSERLRNFFGGPLEIVGPWLSGLLARFLLVDL